jgi:Mn-dependent DtxR family transcriptional regulator
VVVATNYHQIQTERRKTNGAKSVGLSESLPGLTRNQRKYLEAIADYIREYSYSPSQCKLAARLDVTQQAVQSMLRYLLEKQVVKSGHGEPISITALGLAVLRRKARA